jgi:hypothetical protein
VDRWQTHEPGLTDMHDPVSYRRIHGSFVEIFESHSTGPIPDRLSRSALVVAAYVQSSLARMSPRMTCK